MLLERAAAALIRRHDNLNVVFDQNPHCGEVDLTKQSLHQAAREQCHSRPLRAVLLHQFARVRGCRLQDHRTARKNKSMREQTCSSENAGGKQCQIEQRGIPDCGSRQANHPLGLETSCGNVCMTDLLKDFAIGHVGRAGGFAGQASDTLRGIKVGPGILLQTPVCFLAPQT